MNLLQMKQLFFFLLLASFCSETYATTCSTLNPTISSTDNGTGNFSFDLTFTSNQNHSLTEIEWDFGDGVVVTNTSQFMTHQYFYSGATSFTVTAKCAFEDTLSVVDTCTTSIQVSVPEQLPDIPCPVVALGAPNNCPTGDVGFSWNWCSTLDYQNGETAGSYWTVDYTTWDFGDGSSVTVMGTDSTISHTYNSTGNFSVVATVFFVGDSGEVCAVPAAKVGNYQNSCALTNDPTIIHSFYDIITPDVADPSIYMTIEGDIFCDSAQFSVFNYGEIMGSSPPYTDWSYELFIDGDSVTSGTGIPDNTSPIYQTSLGAGDYTFEIVYTYEGRLDTCSTSYATVLTIDSCEVPCENCSSFKPFPGERYWISAWVREEHASQMLSYSDAHINLGFTGAGTSIDFYPEGEIIDGWQRIVGEFVIPVNTTALDIDLVNSHSTINAYFDDIRIHPFNASMKSYVYDPETLWLTAELDDNNYATFYEYNKEGELTRIKKETARGIMTIQESRSNNPKSE